MLQVRSPSRLLFVVSGAVALYCTSSARAQEAAPDRYGPFGLLDHRSRYGQYWFPEPFRADETDVDNELRFDWVHEEGKGRVADDAKAELEKSFGLLTVEAELPYQRETVLTTDPATGASGHDRAEGVGNVSVGARHPLWQVVSDDEFFDNTIGAAFEVGIPVNSSVSENAELVPKLFDDLRLGEHFSLQTILGYSFLTGPQPDGRRQTFEYAAVLGWSIDHDELPLPGVERLTPILEILGDTATNRDAAGQNTLTGTLGLRVNLNAIGPLQPRLGIGYVFPIDKTARDEFDWGIVTSVVFEY